MSTQLARIEPEIDWLQPQSLEGALALAGKLADAEIVPEAFQKKPANILVAIAVGRRLGFDAYTAMTALYVQRGKAGLTADAMVALCKRDAACKFFRKVEESDTSVTWETQRAGSEPESCTVTMEQANLAGWPQRNPQYRTNPRRMLSARAKSFLARDVYPDLMLGIPSKEEIEDEQLEELEQRREEYREEKEQKGSFADRAKARSREKLKTTVKPKTPEPWDADAAPAEQVVDAVPDEQPAAVAPVEDEAPLATSVPIIDPGANNRRYVSNWREFAFDRDGAAFIAILPHGPKAGTKITTLDEQLLAQIYGLVKLALRNNLYEADALRARLDWLTPEELRSMDQALCNTLELATQGDRS